MDDLTHDPQIQSIGLEADAFAEPISSPKISGFEQFLQDGVDALPSGFALFDANERAVLTNKTFRDMLPSGAELLANGATFPEMARHNALTFFGVDEAAADAWLEKRLAYRESPKGVFDQKLTDGRWFRIQETRTADGGTITNWTDITDLKMQEQVAENYATALTNTNNRLKEFAHVASHDLQEPLRKIEVFGERLVKKCGSQLDDSGKGYLDRMVDATGRMRRLISDLLDYSKIDNQGELFEPVDLNAVFDDAMKTLEFRIQDTGARITKVDLPVVTGDFGQLSRLFMNLISNAIKYVAKGTIPEISVAVSEQTVSKIEIRVSDNGIGFDQSQAEKIFEVFQRLHGRGGTYEGTGIGLASCRKIVDQHNGEIRATSQPNVGSQFYVVFPVQS